ncbi:hypothetical protein [Ornithinimicrobium cryptoxanthini]|uniref:hypothetical protein n=1 Tax=Ornithinimicrobium cryptoxanthini TaxID=2934161 RepID=UPI0021199EE4|nr:hypothetical protein [Ornithinimicrobium cryptoxanthini]
MPLTSDELSKGDARKSWRGYPETAKAVLQIMKKGWVVRREGKHYRAYCPCGVSDFTLAGSPGRDAVHANKVRGNASKCPKQHEVLRARKRQGPAR